MTVEHTDCGISVARLAPTIDAVDVWWIGLTWEPGDERKYFAKFLIGGRWYGARFRGPLTNERMVEAAWEAYQFATGTHPVQLARAMANAPGGDA